MARIRLVLTEKIEKIKAGMYVYDIFETSTRINLIDDINELLECGRDMNLTIEFIGGVMIYPNERNIGSRCVYAQAIMWKKNLI